MDVHTSIIDWENILQSDKELGCAAGFVSGGLNVTFKNGGHNKGDHVSGEGDIELRCAKVIVTYQNLSVTATVVKRWLPWPHLAKVYVTQDEHLICSMGNTSANVTGTATAGKPPDSTASQCVSK